MVSKIFSETIKASFFYLFVLKDLPHKKIPQKTQLVTKVKIVNNSLPSSNISQKSVSGRRKAKSTLSFPARPSLDPVAKSWYPNLLSANHKKWSNTFKQFVGKLPTNCLNVFDDFVGLALERLTEKYNFVYCGFSKLTV